MVNVRPGAGRMTSPCGVEGCIIFANQNYAGEKQGVFCFDHR